MNTKKSVFNRKVGACKSATILILDRCASRPLEMKKYLIFLLEFVALSSFSQTREAFNNIDIVENKVIQTTDIYKSIVDSTIAEVLRIDEYLSKNQNSIEQQALTYNSNKPVKVYNNKWPEMLVTEINILRRSNGQIFYYAELPISESGDWSIMYTHYFDINGNVIAFKREANFFNTLCGDDLVNETSIYIFDKNHTLISKSYSLSDSQMQGIINDKDCMFNYDYEYIIMESLEDIVN
ncbi:hypothetical protein [Flammeovirga kamogawensis]|uniref:Uncharacterized protein n=1 Tax=Flammeovirga kamogawensis TaxID=373891 RepID=A0ABX8H4A2_9BACT|nr:hypothetical protein [Flammeovirga kamogawensis]MBB6461852.1 hypothetical protein [Flammeovirga kamogawensis]QWG10533.1 hypothetical protein KM029_26535 [Flammeovirga kamogawensis]TRX63642.1 hypothetical protein EO216_24810 [Flammeovirga kamogawensis]